LKNFTKYFKILCAFLPFDLSNNIIHYILFWSFIMKRFFIFLTVILSLILIISSCKENTTTPDAQLAISGVVLNETGQPINGALVELLAAENKIISNKTTDTTGKFSFSVVSNDIKSFQIRITAPGYQQLVKQATEFIQENKSKNLDLFLSKLQDLDCCGQLTIKVNKFDSDDLIAGAQVKLSKDGQIIDTKNTNDAGKVVFSKLCAGKYWVRIAKDGYQVKEADFTIEGNCDTVSINYALKVQEQQCCNNVAKYTIKDADGNPIKGARVFLRIMGVVKHEATADENGKITITGICKGEYSTLIKYEGYVSQELAQTFDCEQTLEKAITLQKAEQVCCNNVAKFIIKDADGNPVKGARVLLRISGVTKYEGTADADGKVVIDGICKANYSVLIKYEGYVSQEVALNYDCGQTLEKSITLVKNSELCCNNVAKYTIKDAEGNPIKGARVFLRIMGVVKHEATADENGNITITGICKGEYSTLIKYEGYTSQEVAQTFNCEQTLEKAVTLVKSNDNCCNNKISFVIKNAEGQAINGANVKLRVNGVVKYSGSTNDAGKLVIEGICKGTYSVLISYDGYTSQEMSLTFDCGQNLEKAITMQKNDNCCNNITKFIVKDADGNPIKGATVLLRVGGVTKYSGTTDVNGKVGMDGICKGTYSVLIKYEGYVSQEMSLTFDCGQTIEKVVTLVKSNDNCCNNKITFVVKNADGQAINGASVKLKVNGVVKYSGSTNDAGKLIIEGICKGSYSILISYDGYASQDGTLTFDCGQSLEKSITLQKNDNCCNNNITFFVKNADGQVIKGATVLMRINGATKYSGTTNESGKLTIDGICKATYSVLIKYEGYVSQEVSITFDCGQSLEKSITLLKSDNCCNNNITFTVKNADGQVIKGATVLLRISGVTKYSGTTNDNGKLSIDGICKATYSVLIKYEGYVSQEVSITFDCGQSLEKSITLQKNDNCCTAWAKILPFDSESKVALNGAKVRIWKNGSLYKTIYVENGYVKFTELCEGTYGFDVTYEGYVAIEWNAEIKCNYENIFEKPMVKN
jgi:hypothetical protein